jgi:hypothetical protein
VEALVEDQQAPKAQIIEQLKERELQRLIAQKIRFIRGKMRAGSTTLVSVDQPGGGTKHFVQKEDIEREILLNNHATFQQSHPPEEPIWLQKEPHKRLN